MNTRHLFFRHTVVRYLVVGLVFLAAAWLLAAVPASQAQNFSTETGMVQFHSRVPLHDFTGTSEQLHGLVSFADSTVDFYVDLATLSTGNGKRDRDMRRSLDVEQFPFAEFTGTFSGGFDPANATAQDVVASGEFSVHGVDQFVEVAGTLRPVDGGIELLAEWTLNLKDYDVRPPRLLIMKVADEQRIELKALLKPQDS